MNELAGSNQLVPSRHGTYKRVRAAICKHCPACKQARKNPASIVGKFLHHPWHSTHCPVWKAYNEVYGEKEA